MARFSAASLRQWGSGVFGSNKKIAKLQKQIADASQILKSIDLSQAKIVFNIDGIIIDANENFLKAVGYSLSDIVGQHHRMFVARDYAASDDYRRFWSELGAGKCIADKFKRVTKGGETIWLQASYSPVLDSQGRPSSVTMLAIDITAAELASAQSLSNPILNALDQSQASIVFNLDGTIVEANENFLKTVGYRAEEIIGQHHSLFVDPAHADSEAYRQFWRTLNNGEFVAGKFSRVGKAGNQIWLQASYNPVLDGQGRPHKVVKYAVDITAAEQANEYSGANQIIKALDQSQARIEFNLDGTIITANENFLKAVGYLLHEIVGQHHRMFVRPAYAATEEYRRFWGDLANGKVLSGKYERVGKSGDLIWLQANYIPVTDKDGRPVKLIKFAVNITDAELAAARDHDLKARADSAQAQVTEVLADRLARMSKGDLTARIDIELDPSFAKIKSDYNSAIDGLARALRSVTESAGGIQTGANEITSASDDLSRRTEQQAASLEETAAALDQITVTVARSSEGARKVASAMTDARSDATQSGEVVQYAVKAMGEIEQSSRQIGQIVGVIDEIAFQTNLLALNAGVEAARAGDAGRGFAVVASEVRSLAQRCGEAAKEIKGLISASSGQVDAGVKLVAAAGESLVRIVANITEIDALISEIATSSTEQATGLSQVNSAVNQMDQVTQQNAAMVEEVTAAASSLQSETAELARQMAQFNTGLEAPTSRRLQPADPVRDKPARNLVAQVQSRLAKLPTNLGAATAEDLGQWDEF